MPTYPANFEHGCELARRGAPFPRDAENDVVAGYLAQESGALGFGTTGQAWKVVEGLDSAASLHKINSMRRETVIRRAAGLIGEEHGIEADVAESLTELFDAED